METGINMKLVAPPDTETEEEKESKRLEQEENRRKEREKKFKIWDKMTISKKMKILGHVNKSNLKRLSEKSMTI